MIVHHTDYIQMVLNRSIILKSPTVILTTGLKMKLNTFIKTILIGIVKKVGLVSGVKMKHYQVIGLPNRSIREN
jgi:hypothetical protein